MWTMGSEVRLGCMWKGLEGLGQAGWWKGRLYEYAGDNGLRAGERVGCMGQDGNGLRASGVEKR